MDINTILQAIATVGFPICACIVIGWYFHTNYRLWDTNYFAYDYINGTKQFEDKYADMSTKSFVKHYRHLRPEVQEMVFRGYANPVFSMLQEKENEK